LVISPGPAHKPAIGQLIDQPHQPLALFDQHRSGTMPFAILPGQGAQFSQLSGRYRIQASFACLAAGQDPDRVELATGAATGWFAAFAPHQVKGTLDHGGAGLEEAKCLSDCAVKAPELLADSGDAFAHVCV